MERRITFEPAFDRRDPDPSKNYGIHGVTLRFLLIGDAGAVQFVLYTGWYLPHVQEEFEKRGDFPRVLQSPMPADLGYHAKERPNDWVNHMDCDLVEGGKCYYDGSSLNAEPVYDTLVAEGSDGVWDKLEDYYRETFKTPEGEE